MTKQTIMFSNLGYAKGINGTLWQHLSGFHRHFYCRVPLQVTVLSQLKSIIDLMQPDLCCFVEIDRGSIHTGGLNQIQNLVDESYSFYDVADKYGPKNHVGRLPLHTGKSNGFLSKHPLSFERLYFTSGSKRLLYKIVLTDMTHVYFAHFSLQRKIRAQQFSELNAMIKNTSHPVIILADFNIFTGFSELDILLNGTDIAILNNENEPTFTFASRRLALDLCVCSKSLLSDIALRIIPQPFSDHAALLLEINTTNHTNHGVDLS